MNNVTLSFNQELHWTFPGLNLNISQCDLDSVRITVQIHNHAEQVLKNPVIIIHNSSFDSLDLKPTMKAQLTDCYIDGKMKQRPTLITANNSDVSIRNCHFEHFITD